jgi:sugar lactone lactonase YvrE
MRAEQLTDAVAYHAEGPVWSESWGGLRWVDMLAGDVLTLGAGGAIDRRHVGTVAAVVRPRRGGGAVIAVERGFLLEDGDGELTELLPVFDDTGVRMNGAGAIPTGASTAARWATTTRRERAPCTGSIPTCPFTR